MALEQAPHHAMCIAEKKPFLQLQPLGHKRSKSYPSYLGESMNIDVEHNEPNAQTDMDGVSGSECPGEVDFGSVAMSSWKTASFGSLLFGGHGTDRKRSESYPGEFVKIDVEHNEPNTQTDVETECPGEVDFSSSVDKSSWITASFESFRHPGATELLPCPPCPRGDFAPITPPAFSEPSEVIANMSRGSHQAAILRATQLECQAAQFRRMAASIQQNQSIASPTAEMKSSFTDRAPLPNPIQVERNMTSSHWTSKSQSAEKDQMKSKNVKDTSSAGKDTSPYIGGDRTTLMLRNLPNNYTREMLIQLLDAEGFGNTYDFVYLPMDFHRMAGLGYAFVNLISRSCAEKLKDHFHGFTSWTLASQKICAVSWGEPLQGLEAHIERFRNHAVMHTDVPEKYKPIVFKHGARVPFPPPTKAIRPPRLKKLNVAWAKMTSSSDDGDGVDDN